MKTSTYLAALLFAPAVTTVANGQSVNIDFGSDARAPADTYAAAGLPGVWNVIEPSPGVPAALVDLEGALIEATVLVSQAYQPMALDDPDTTGNDATLLDDFLPGLGDVAVSLSFEGLTAGVYRLTTYGWVPTLPEEGSTIFIGDGIPWNGQVIGGPWPGGLVEGVTHAVHEVEVTDGSILVSMIGSYWWTTGAFNGVQLERVAFLAADVNHDGFVNAADLVTVLLNWTAPGHGCDGVAPCTGDVNDDLVVDVQDLLLVIGAWTG